MNEHHWGALGFWVFVGLVLVLMDWNVWRYAWSMIRRAAIWLWRVR